MNENSRLLNNSVVTSLPITVCRALGLPARSVTNFSSAHDTNCSLTIDTVMCLNKDGGMDRIPELSNDSVWYVSITAPSTLSANI